MLFYISMIASSMWKMTREILHEKNLDRNLSYNEIHKSYTVVYQSFRQLLFDLRMAQLRGGGTTTYMTPQTVCH